MRIRKRLIHLKINLSKEDITMKSFMNSVSIIISFVIAILLSGFAGMVEGPASYLLICLSIIAMSVVAIALYLKGKEIEDEMNAKMA